MERAASVKCDLTIAAATNAGRGVDPLGRRASIAVSLAVDAPSRWMAAVEAAAAEAAAAAQKERII